MPEQKAEKKKPVIFRRILNRIGLTLLVIVLILALGFQVSWKVTTLLLITLLACTILPRPYRKWFWISAGVVVLVLAVWVFLPDGNDIWQPHTFDEKLAAHEAKFAVPEEENAATIYNRLLQDFVPKEWRLMFLNQEAYNQASTGPWLSRNHPELTQWLRSHEKTITNLPQACQIKTCRFPSIFKISPTDKLETNRYSALKSWAFTLLLSGNNDIAEERPNEAFSKYICALQIKDHLYQQKRIVDLLIAFGIEGLAFPPLNRFLIENKPSEKQLQILSDVLGNLENNWSSDCSECLEYDKLFVTNTFCSLLYQTNSKGRLRLSRDPAAAIWGRRWTTALAETYWQKKSMKAYTILAWFFLPSTPQKAAEMIDTIFEECSAMTDPDFAWDKENIVPTPTLTLNCRFVVNSLTNKSTKFYGGFHDIYLKRLAQRRGLRLLIAIKLYNIKNGYWPKNLDAVKSSVPAEAFIDPLNNGSFIYKPGDDNFVLYSKGKNNIDENGKRYTRSSQDTGPDDWLIWPPRNRKTQKENITNDTTLPEGL
jgi:hypothetical protein